MRILVLPKLYWLLITHLNGWDGSQYFSCWLPCFDFFMCSCWSSRIHPTLEKLVAQNIAALEYQGKHLKLSDHWITETGWHKKIQKD